MGKTGQLINQKKGRYYVKIEAQKFRIGELAEKLNLERYVLRFWEKKFDIQAKRSSGGQRFYNMADMEKFMLIKELLYDKGFTISGAKQFLKKNKKTKVTDKQLIVASQVTTMDQLEPLTEPAQTITPSTTCAMTEQFKEQILHIRQKLAQLSELL